MKLTVSVALLFAMIFLGLSACSKEKKIERSLQRKDGVWDVVNYHNLYYHYFEDDTVFSETNVDNYATFRFSNNGRFESTGEKWYNNYEGTWANTEDELVITGKDVVEYNSTAIVYQVIEQSRDKMTLKRSIRKNDIQWFEETEIFKLERRK